MRPHAQIYPRAYLDLADEMGICVLDETAVFRLNAWGVRTTESAVRFLVLDGAALPAANRLVMRCGLGGPFVKSGAVALTASRTDWFLFNRKPEEEKVGALFCYEKLAKPAGAALVSRKVGGARWRSVRWTIPLTRRPDTFSGGGSSRTWA